MSKADRILAVAASVALPSVTGWLAWRGYSEAVETGSLAQAMCEARNTGSIVSAATCALEGQSSFGAVMASSGSIVAANWMAVLTVCWFAILIIWVAIRWIRRG